MSIAELVAALQRDILHLKRTVAMATALAPVRLPALAVRISSLANAVIHRSRLPNARLGQLVIVRRLVIDSLKLTEFVRSNNIIMLFLEREAIAHKVRVLQAQISNLGLRLAVVLPPHRASNDAQQAAADAIRFNALLHRYSSANGYLQALVKPIPHGALAIYHRRLEAEISRGSMRLTPQAFRFAITASRVIEMHLRAARRPIPLLRNNASAGATAITATARMLTSQTPHASYAGRMTRSTPLRPLDTPRLPHSARLDERRVHFEDAAAPDPVLYSDGTAFHPSVFQDSQVPLLFPPSSAEQDGYAESGPFLRTSRVSFTASPREHPIDTPVSPSQRDIIVRYYDSSTGRTVEWHPFQGWLWPLPSTLDHVIDYNGRHIRPGMTIISISSFTTLDETVSLAILDRVIAPSKAPPMLSSRDVGLGTRLKVLHISNIQNTAWLACSVLAPSSGGLKVGFIPLKAIIHEGLEPPATVPRRFVLPLHSSARSFEAVFRFSDVQGRMKLATVRGVVHKGAVSYYEILPDEMGARRVRWFHIPWTRILGIGRAGATRVDYVKLEIRDADRDRQLEIHFRSGLEGEYFLRNLDRMWQYSFNDVVR